MSAPRRTAFPVEFPWSGAFPIRSYGRRISNGVYNIQAKEYTLGVPDMTARGISLWMVDAGLELYPTTLGFGHKENGQAGRNEFAI